MSDNSKQNRPDSLIRELVTGAVPLDWANFIVVMIIVLIAIVFVMAYWIGDMESKEKIEFIRTIVITAGGIVGVFVAYTGHKRNALTQETNEINRQQNEESNRLSKSSQLDDRFAKAVEMLSHESPSVISGGLYLLRDVALEDHQRYLDTVLDIIEDVLRALIVSIQENNLPPDSCEPQSAEEQQQLEESFLGGNVLSLGTCIDLPHYVSASLSITRTLRKKYREIRKTARRQLNLTNLEFLGVSLANLDLQDVNFENTKFSFTDLTGVNLFGSTLKTVSFFRCNLNKANLADSKISGSKFQQVSADEMSFIGAHFRGKTTFEYCSLSEASFNHASLLEELVFFKVNLSRCKFQHTRVIGGLRIEESKLDYANLKEIDIEHEADIFSDDGVINLKGTSLSGTVLPIDLSEFFNIKEESLCEAHPVKYNYLPSGILHDHKELIYRSQKLYEESVSVYYF